MTVFAFESEGALRFAIMSRLVPEDVSSSPATTWRDGEAIYVKSAAAGRSAAMKRLAKAGVQQAGSAEGDRAGTRDVRCWAEIVAPVAAADPDEFGQVLFVLSEDDALCELAGELIRLGCDRFEWRSSEGEHVIRAPSPPYYSLARAMDRMGDVRAYVPSPRGQEDVYVELGWQHPLAAFLRPDAGQSVLVSGPSTPRANDHRFRTLGKGAFEDAYALIDLRTPADPRTDRTHVPLATAPRFAVTLRLARAASVEAPSLWVLREDAVKKTSRLLASLPDEVARTILFAVAGEPGSEIVVLRARPGTKTTIEVDGEGYRPHPAIPTLFLPLGATLEPPLRRDRIGAVLSIEPDVVVWLRALDGGSFHVERLHDASFQPLDEWVEYVIDTNAPKLVPWVRSTTFDFQAYVGEEPAPARPRPPRVVEAPEEEEDDGGRKKKRSAVEAAPKPATRTRARSAPTAAPEIATAPRAAAPVLADAQRLAELEKALVDSESAGDDPAQRAALWEEMAPIAARIGRHEDATMAWSRALWQLSPAEVSTRAAAWVGATTALVGHADAASLLAGTPTPAHVRALAATLIAGTDASLASRAHEASLWLDREDGVLDIRTAWLARVSLGELVGGDRLGLARARDRLLGRIHAGLSLERDVPSFLRRAGGSRDVGQVELLTSQLETLFQHVSKAKRQRSATEAKPELTGAYVGFVFAYGAARLGRVEWARTLRERSLAALNLADPVHGFLAHAFAARIEQALAGLPPESALPPDVTARLEALAKMDRYKADRVRQCSKILEPQERLDPIAAFQRGEADPRGPEFAELRRATERDTVAKLVGGIMKQAKTAPAAERARLYDGVMDFFPLVAQETALDHLATIQGTVEDVEATRRAQVLEEALMLAGHFGAANLVRTIFGALEPLITSATPDSASEIAPVVGGMLRTLRRVGLKDEASRLLVAIQAAARGSDVPHLVARLHAASGLAYLGDIARARATFDQASAALAGTLATPERLLLTRAFARALGAAPIEMALAGLSALQKGFEFITDSFHTNSHVCLSVVDWVEAVVLGYASDELVIGQALRRWLDDDEYQVRRRIHQDMGR